MKSLIYVVLGLASTVALAQDRVSKFDRNSDGKVSFEEINHFCKVSIQSFKNADDNNDGYLSNGEMRRAKGFLERNCSK